MLRVDGNQLHGAEGARVVTACRDFLQKAQIQRRLLQESRLAALVAAADAERDADESPHAMYRRKALANSAPPEVRVHLWRDDSDQLKCLVAGCHNQKYFLGGRYVPVCSRYCAQIVVHAYESRYTL